MSLSYSPSDGAAPDKYWAPKFLSNRDITGQAPIDKTVYPGAHVTRACHSDGIYDSDAFQTCFSNLLAVGFRRLVIDLYWSASNHQFQLCPVSIPQFSNGTEADATATPQQMPPRRDLYDKDLYVRQTSSANGTSSFESSNATSTSPSSSSTSAEPTTSVGQSGTTLITLGPYSCSQGLSLGSIVDIMDDYIDITSDATAATLQILVFNLHSAASSNSPGGPPQNVSIQDMPSTTESVGYNFHDGLDSQLFRPGDLQADRANLNLSWYQVRASERLPMTDYYTINRDPDGSLSTDDGWPSEIYLILSRLERIILVWGSISPEMAAYNFQQDSQWIFPTGYLSVPRALEQNDNGAVTSGCFYDSDDTSITDVNNTWALRTVNDSQIASQPAFLRNMTACGVTPILNETLNGTDADDNLELYKRYGESLLIGWADGEPTNASSPGVNVEGPEDQYRCVVLDSSSAYRGKWRVISCQNEFRAACRVGSRPFDWRLSTQPTDFTGAPDICPEGSSFDVPVTQLENTYLYAAVQAYAANESQASNVDLVWINLNSLDSVDCWVTTGPNGTCRYQADAEEEHNRQVLIPTIAALIVLVLTVLTILVKCNVNRRNNRRHRTGPGGWEYEGVPS